MINQGLLIISTVSLNNFKHTFIPWKQLKL